MKTVIVILALSMSACAQTKEAKPYGPQTGSGPNASTTPGYNPKTQDGKAFGVPMDNPNQIIPTQSRLTNSAYSEEIKKSFAQTIPTRTTPDDTESDDRKVGLCFKIDSMTVDPILPYEVEAHYTITAHSECMFEIQHVAIGVKYFDQDGYRIGVGLWIAQFVAQGEKIKHQFRAIDIPAGKLAEIKTALVTTDWKKANEYWPVSGASGASITLGPGVVIDNFSGTVRK